MWDKWYKAVEELCVSPHRRRPRAGAAQSTPALTNYPALWLPSLITGMNVCIWVEQLAKRHTMLSELIKHCGAVSQANVELMTHCSRKHWEVMEEWKHTGFGFSALWFRLLELVQTRFSGVKSPTKENRCKSLHFCRVLVTLCLTKTVFAWWRYTIHSKETDWVRKKIGNTEIDMV